MYRLSLRASRYKVSHHLCAKFDINGEIVLHRWHHRRDELQENEQRMVNLNLRAIFKRHIEQMLHDISMLARVNTQLLDSQMRMSFISHGLFGVFIHDIFEHFRLAQRQIVFSVSAKPESRSVIVKIICNCQLVVSSLNLWGCYRFKIVLGLLFGFF